MQRNTSTIAVIKNIHHALRGNPHRMQNDVAMHVYIYGCKLIARDTVIHL